jgi:hypothetical protein
VGSFGGAAAAWVALKRKTRGRPPDTVVGIVLIELTAYVLWLEGRMCAIDERQE